MDPGEEGRAERADINAETRVEIAATTISAGRGREEDMRRAEKKNKAPKIELTTGRSRGRRKKSEDREEK